LAPAKTRQADTAPRFDILRDCAMFITANQFSLFSPFARFKLLASNDQGAGHSTFQGVKRIYWQILHSYHNFHFTPTT
jgi:hypothetical protein